MKRAVAIKTVGDAEIGGVLTNALMKPLESTELATVKAELEKTKAENAELGVRKVRDNKAFNKKMRKLKRKYPPARKLTKPEEMLLVGWALMWLGIFAAYTKLSAWNRAK